MTTRIEDFVIARKLEKKERQRQEEIGENLLIRLEIMKGKIHNLLGDEEIDFRFNGPWPLNENIYEFKHVCPKGVRIITLGKIELNNLNTERYVSLSPEEEINIYNWLLQSVIGVS